MSEQENKKSISEEVLSKIKKGNIKMKPRIIFVIKLALLVLSTIIITFFALFVASFIFFTLRTSGMLLLPSFGPPGFKILFFSLPWVLILGLIALMTTSELFAKHFPFVYKKPILYSALVMVLIVFLGGFILNNTGVHANLFQKTRDGRLPIIEPFYREYGMPRLDGMHYGIVSQIENNGFRIKTPRQDELLISVLQSTKMPKSEIEEGDTVIILGKKNGNTVKADEVRKTNRDFDIFPKSPPPPRKPF